MSALLTEPSPRLWTDTADRAHRPRREPTLADLVATAWEGLESAGVPACPACGGALAARHAAAGADVIGGRCLDCGSTLD